MVDFIAKQGIKLILFAKAIVLVIVLVDQQWLEFGEKELLGQNQNIQKPVDQQSTIEGAATGKNFESLAEDEANSNSQSPGKGNRLMDDLLNLPSIDSKDLKKEEVEKYFKILDRKHSQVSNRLKILNAKYEQLKQLESSIDDKLKKLEEEIQFFEQTRQSEKDLQEDRMEKLVNFYQKMNPKKAAPVFERLDKDLVVQLFNRIPQNQTREILSLMTPEKSVELSEYFGRIRSAKEYELLKEINTSLLKEFEACKTM